MVSRIKLLPIDIYSRIAAGEVIERPANIVKELIENSIDAKATEIIIEIFSAGKKLIRVSDNGVGMTKEELLLSTKPHATSKISKFEDIYKLSTLGFRGEGLSSIVSVSKTKINSKTQDSETGNEIIIYGNEIISSNICACNNGTSVEITDLFYNTPARLKFLKSDYTEKVHIIKIVEEYCIAYKNISFKLIVDGNLLFSTTSTPDIKKRVQEILGNDTMNGIIYFEHKETNDLSVSGFISKLDFTQVNKSLQMFFVNKRPITSRVISQALYEAYRDSLPIGRHPVGIIFIEINSSDIDVNVHPTKRMIKFKSDNKIFDLLRDVIRTQFKKNLTQQKGFFHNNYEDKKSFSNCEYKTEINLNSKPTNLQKELDFKDSKFSTTDNTNFSTSKNLDIKKTFLNPTEYIYLGQLNKTYLLFETKTGLTLIDQHAASERIIFEQFLNKNSYVTQKLLIPVNIDLKISDLEILKPQIEIINSLGFEINVTGKNSIGISGIPSILVINDTKDFLNRFIEYLISDIKEVKQNISSKERIIRSACRAAIKAKDILTLKDVDKIILELSNCEQPFTCPHGRPTILNIEISDIEKMFLRKK